MAENGKYEGWGSPGKLREAEVNCIVNESIEIKNLQQTESVLGWIDILPGLSGAREGEL